MGIRYGLTRMESRKIAETRTLVRQSCRLLRQHLGSDDGGGTASVTDSRLLYDLLKSIQAAVSILRSFESSERYSSIYDVTLTAVAQVLGLQTNDAPPPPTAASSPDFVRSTTAEDSGLENAAASSLTSLKYDGFTPVLPTEDSPRWASVFGCDEVIMVLQQATTLPLQYPTLFTGPRKPWHSLLLYGPPGTGKTQLAAATAAEYEAPFLRISSADLLSKWVGESEKQVRHAFATAAKFSRCILFFDEVDAICCTRGGHGETEVARRLKTELLLHLQTAPPSVTVIAATNLPWELDAAIRRRFDRLLYVGLPSAEAKRAVVRRSLLQVTHNITDEQLNDIMQKTENFSVDDVLRMSAQAVMGPVTDLLSSLSYSKNAASFIQQSGPPSPPFNAGADCNSGHYCGLESSNDGASETQVDAMATNYSPLHRCSSEEVNLSPPPVESHHFYAALAAVFPTSTSAEIQRYKDWSIAA